MSKPKAGLTREHIIWAYRLLLNREPESEQAIQSYFDVYPSMLEAWEAILVSPEYASKPKAGLTREHIIWAYRLLLNREPESEQAIQSYFDVYPSMLEAWEAILVSPEYAVENPAGRVRPLAGNLPVPPDELVFLITGSRDRHWYLEGGRRAAQSIIDILGLAKVNLTHLNGILDFGCGCGRVIRHLAPFRGLRGTDYNPRLIEWCRASLPFAEFDVNGLAPPLPYADASFDLVYLLSVMTHLTEELQDEWMRELSRIVRPGSYLLISTHGEAYFDQLDRAEKESFRETGCAVRFPEEKGTNTCGAFHSEDYVRSRLAGSHGFSVEVFVPEGAKGNPRQDAYLLRRR